MDSAWPFAVYSNLPGILKSKHLRHDNNEDDNFKLNDIPVSIGWNVDRGFLHFNITMYLCSYARINLLLVDLNKQVPVIPATPKYDRVILQYNQCMHIDDYGTALALKQTQPTR